MSVQLLLLLALVGPFCAFTHASPTVFPSDFDVGTVETVEEVTASFTDVTGPPTFRPATDAEETETAAATEAYAIEVDTTEADTPVADTTEADTTEADTTEAQPDATVNTEEPVIETEAAATAAPEPLITDPPAAETAAPTEQAEAEVEPVATGAAEAETNEEVVVEDGTAEGLSSGQVVGIVIGALLAMIIVIAVVIAVVRRMGKYSSAKNKKPAKKDSVMALRKKPAKLQERQKFWKF